MIGIAILPVSHDMIGNGIVCRYMIHLCDGQINVFPGFASIKTHVHTAIVGYHYTLGIGRVEPDIVVIASGFKGSVSIKCFATIFRFHNGNTDGVQFIFIL